MFSSPSKGWRKELGFFVLSFTSERKSSWKGGTTGKRNRKLGRLSKECWLSSPTSHLEGGLMFPPQPPRLSFHLVLFMHNSQTSPAQISLKRTDEQKHNHLTTVHKTCHFPPSVHLGSALLSVTIKIFIGPQKASTVCSLHPISCSETCDSENSSLFSTS